MKDLIFFKNDLAVCMFSFAIFSFSKIINDFVSKMKRMKSKYFS